MNTYMDFVSLHILVQLMSFRRELRRRRRVHVRGAQWVHCGQDENDETEAVRDEEGQYQEWVIYLAYGTRTFKNATESFVLIIRQLIVESSTEKKSFRGSELLRADLWNTYPIREIGAAFPFGTFTHNMLAARD